MATKSKPHISPEEYLEIERAAEYKSEYHDGEIFGLPGASRRHNLIALNLASELRLQLKGRDCETYINDMRLRVTATGLYTYPDVVVVCGEPAYLDNKHDTLLNPAVIFEVLPESTEAYDRGQKFEHYRSLESLTDYLLVAQSSARIDHFTRGGKGRWHFDSIAGLDNKLVLPNIQCTLDLAEVYDRVSFDDDAVEGEASRR